MTFVFLEGYALLLEPPGSVLSSALSARALTLCFGNRKLFIFFVVMLSSSWSSFSFLPGLFVFHCRSYHRSEEFL